MSVPQNEELLENLAEEWYNTLVNSGWSKNDWQTWTEARDRARAEWKEGYER
jgi:predicted secreted acid phosphatase|tara:strand:- start:56 stop:211 length:156 start_codon:yes stop_codon:yes gene_type:complete